jgi:hypothetical protein
MKHQNILDKMWVSYEEEYNKTNYRRTYLGMSVSEENCGRKPWLEFRHAFDPWVSYSSASHFQDGHLSEDAVAKRLKDSGLNLITHDETGEQFSLQDMYWHRGHIDGKLPDYDALWEHKSTGDAKLTKLKKLIDKDEETALLKWSKGYYDQATRYMGYSGIHKHITTVASHGSREKINSQGDHRTAIMETAFDQDHFNFLVGRAKHIITTDKMPQAAWSLAVDKPLCIWKNGKCEAYDFCKGKEIGKPNCRNCGHVTFTTEGATCALGKEDLNEKNMLEFKECHKYNPELVHEFFVVDLDDAGDVHYRNESGTELVNRNSNDFRLEFNKLGG